MASPLISVALPVFNGADFIEAAVRSLLEQDADLEVIVSDDNSTDRTLEILESLQSERLTVIRNKQRGGQFVNFNRAIGRARGQYIQFFSHDDVAHPGFLAAQLDGFRTSEKTGLVYSSCNIIDSAGHRLHVLDDEGTPVLIDFPTYLDISSLHGALPPSISSVMVSKEALAVAGIFDPRFRVAGDLEFFNRVAEHFCFARNRRTLLDVRVHPGSVTSNAASQMLYMQEEILLLPFYRRHLGSDGYRAMLAERTRRRGADHARYLLKLLLRGKWKDFLRGYKLLAQVHCVPLCAFHAVKKLVVGR